MYNSRKEVPDDTYYGKIGNAAIHADRRRAHAAPCGHGRAALGLAAAGCGSSGSPSGSGSSSPAAGHAGGTYTILASSAFGVADPAQNYTLEEWQLLIDTHDGLVQFLRVGGSAGTKLVPDLATTIPAPTDGGKT